MNQKIHFYVHAKNVTILKKFKLDCRDHNIIQAEQTSSCVLVGDYWALSEKLSIFLRTPHINMVITMNSNSNKSPILSMYVFAFFI
jgi:hypothetical protein